MKRLSAVILALTLAMIMLLTACSTLTGASGVSFAVASTPGAGYQPPAAEDFSALSWTRAFDSLHEKFSREYAFTEWKGIDWDALYSQFQPKFARAEAAEDRNAYYLALREYVHSIPDGHVGIEGSDLGLQKEAVGGGFGLTIARLDNGRVAVTWVKEGGPAAAAGIKTGAVILAWNGQPVMDAIEAASILFGPITPTNERRIYEQVRFLMRSPVGAERTVTFKNADAAADTTATLRAIDDNMETLDRTAQGPKIALTGWPESIIEQEILPGNVGYISIFGEIDLDASLPGDHTPTLELFRNAVDGFIDRNVAGIIIDVRGNAGGSDQMVADFMASFYNTRTLYEYQTWYNALTGKLEQRFLDDATGEALFEKGLYIEPLSKRFTGPVVALVDNGCVSSGEGVALCVKNLPNGKVVGLWGTNGSFGMSGDKVAMPGGYIVDWPYGQSLDEDKVIQLDSRNGEGGVLPNARVPLTLDNAVRIANGEDVVLEYGLQVLSQMQTTWLVPGIIVGVVIVAGGLAAGSVWTLRRKRKSQS